MDQSEVQELLVNVLSMYGNDIATLGGAQNQGGPQNPADTINGLQQIIGQLKHEQPSYQGGRGGGQNQYGRGAQGSYRGGGYQKQNNFKNFN